MRGQVRSTVPSLFVSKYTYYGYGYLDRMDPGIIMTTKFGNFSIDVNYPPGSRRKTLGQNKRQRWNYNVNLRS